MYTRLFGTIATIGLSLITGCSQTNQGLAPQAQHARVDNQVVSKHVQTSSSVDEYVNRVAKRLITVSDQPQVNYSFKVISSPTPGLAFDQETNSILVSSALLAQLNDEAQLATILNLGLAKYGNLPDPDKTTINNLYRAGYDPKVLVELQEQYFFATSPHSYQWLGNLYSMPISASAINYNKTLLKNMPQGLLRNHEAYVQGING